MEIKEVKLFSEFENFDIKEKDILLTSKNSFFLNHQNLRKIIFTKLDNEIININFKKNYQNIEKIELIMKISKTDLTNKICENNSQ